MNDNLKSNRAQHHCSEHLYGAPVGGSGPGHFYFQEFTMKRCFKCGEEKPKDQFYRHPQMGDGHLGKCMECTKIDVSRNYRDRREQYAQYEKERYQQPERRVYAIQQSNSRKHRHPEKYKACRIVGNRVRDGKLLRQPCSVCGNPKVQAHHEDYSKPLDVIWLCRKHHLELHGKMAYEF